MMASSGAVFVFLITVACVILVIPVKIHGKPVMKGTNVLQQWNGIDYNQQPEEGLSQLPSEDYIQENDKKKVNQWNACTGYGQRCWGGHGKRDVEAANRLHQLALMQQKSAKTADVEHETSEDLNQLISSQG